MGSIPNRFAISQNKYLWRFVSNSGNGREFSRDLPSGLYYDQAHITLKLLHLAVGGGTYRTSVTVFKNDDWSKL
jgi:hypothetical protein